MVDDQPPKVGPVVDEQSRSRWVQIAGIAASIVGKVKALASVSILAGLWLWALLYQPFAFRAWWTAAIAAMVLLLLVAPGGVLFLFQLALRQVVSLPSRLADLAADSRDQSRGAVDTIRTKDDRGASRRTWRIFRATWSLRGLVMEGKDVVLQSVAIARLANPVAITAILIATAAGIALVVLAAVATAAVLVF